MWRAFQPQSEVRTAAVQPERSDMGITISPRVPIILCARGVKVAAAISGSGAAGLSDKFCEETEVEHHPPNKDVRKGAVFGPDCNTTIDLYFPAMGDTVAQCLAA